MPSPRLSLIPFAVAGLLCAAPLTAQPDAGDDPANTPDAAAIEDQGVVDLFFRDKIIAVRRTRDTDDDAMLIAEMIEKAAEVPDSPGVQRLIYETAIELGVSTGAYLSAIDAALQLRVDFPQAAMASDDALLNYYAEAYRETRRADRGEIAEPYLALMVQVAERAESAGEVEKAERLYADALSIARSVRSPLEETLEANLVRINAAAQIENRIRVLRTALEVNSRNASAARELTLLMVLHRKDLSAASEFVALTQDPDLIEVVQMGAHGVEQASPPEALRVADWYVGLADQHREMDGYLLGQAAQFYDRFLEQYARQDALATWVSRQREETQQRLDEIRAEVERLTRGEWRSVIEQIDARTHAIQGPPSIRDGQIAVANTGFVVPFQPEGDYDLRVRVQFERGTDGIIFYLPLGESRGAVYQYSRYEHRRIQIDGVDYIEDKRFLLSPGQSVEIGIEVRLLPNGRASIAGYVDGEACIRWTGAIDDLEVLRHYRPAPRHGNAIAVRTDGRYVFSAIDVREPVE